jgi:hypothetical protein
MGVSLSIDPWEWGTIQYDHTDENCLTRRMFPHHRCTALLPLSVASARRCFTSELFPAHQLSDCRASLRTFPIRQESRSTSPKIS